MIGSLVASVLGEAAVPAEDSAPPIEAPEEESPVSPVNEPTERIRPSLDALAKSWESGSHIAVATRILDAMDNYADFVALCFRLGQDAAFELGHLMDELTAEETSPREFADEELPNDAETQHQHKSLRHRAPAPKPQTVPIPPQE